jgi:hypothetical protein
VSALPAALDGTDQRSISMKIDTDNEPTATMSATTLIA